MSSLSWIWCCLPFFFKYEMLDSTKFDTDFETPKLISSTLNSRQTWPPMRHVAVCVLYIRNYFLSWNRPLLQPIVLTLGQTFILNYKAGMLRDLTIWQIIFGKMFFRSFSWLIHDGLILAMSKTNFCDWFMIAWS